MIFRENLVLSKTLYYMYLYSNERTFCGMELILVCLNSSMMAFTIDPSFLDKVADAESKLVKQEIFKSRKFSQRKFANIMRFAEISCT